MLVAIANIVAHASATCNMTGIVRAEEQGNEERMNQETGNHLSACQPVTCRSYSSIVLKSPSGSPKACARSTRRIILPERVFGSVAGKFTASGLAIGPITLPT